MLKEIHLKNVGPPPNIDIVCASRLNILTGDNGLGKTFLLDIIWWCISRKWGKNLIIPTNQLPEKPEISYTLLIPGTDEVELSRSYFEYPKRWRDTLLTDLLSYPARKKIAIYAQVDGGFSISISSNNKIAEDRVLNFSPLEIWNGIRNKNKVLCNGLIDDWIKWQNHPDQSNFQLLSRVLKQLSATNETIFVGEPTRIDPYDIRDIPTIKLPYETIPVTHASAGIKRILSLAYILVWIQSENLITSKLLKEEPAHQLIFLMDETEAHLHPRWQRTILPAILKIIEELQEKMTVQAFITTHSPLVLASVEPIFDEEQDKLFLFELNQNEVTLNEIPWAKQGDVIGWLTSEIFGLKQARSKEAEQAIEAAQAWMRKDDMSQFPENLNTKEKIHQQLLKLLPGHDPFFPRWIVRMEADD